jgi:hypothetical protein
VVEASWGFIRRVGLWLKLRSCRRKTACGVTLWQKPAELSRSGFMTVQRSILHLSESDLSSEGDVKQAQRVSESFLSKLI